MAPFVIQENFQTNNGKEFTAKTILRFLRHLNPNVLSVIGRPRCPQDQGSVVNMNKLVKRTLGCVLAERRLAHENPNWTEVFGSVAAFINSQYSRGKFDVSAYKAVFGQEFDHEFACLKEEARKCWTIGEQLQVTNDTAFQEYVKEYFYVDADRDQYDSSYEDDLSYFSDDNINETKTKEVDDTFFDKHLMDDVSEDVSKQPALHLDGRKSPHATEDERKHPPAISFDDKNQNETTPKDYLLVGQTLGSK